jgi:hypothetical protein
MPHHFYPHGLTSPALWTKPHYQIQAPQMSGLPMAEGHRALLWQAQKVNDSLVQRFHALQHEIRAFKIALEEVKN